MENTKKYISTLSKLLLVTSIALLPFEMLLGGAGHHFSKNHGVIAIWLFKPALGVLLAFLFLRTKLFATSQVSFRGAFDERSPEKLPLFTNKFQKFTALLILTLLTGYIVSGITRWSHTEYLLPVIVLGPVMMLATFLLMQEKNNSELIIRTLLYGMTFWCLVSIVLYIIAIPYIQTFNHWPSWERFIIQLRYPEDFHFSLAQLPWYYIVVGNINKASNLLLLSLLLQAYYYLSRKISFLTLILMFIPHVILLILLLSRASFLIIASIDLFLLLLTITYSKYFTDSTLNKKKFLTLFILFLLPNIFIYGNPTFRSYSLDTSTMISRIKEFSGILPTKIVAQAVNKTSTLDGTLKIKDSSTPTTDFQAHKYPPVPFEKFQKHDFSFYFLGYGVANFGLSQGFAPEVGSHFLIFDTWFEGGMLSFLALLTIFGLYIVTGAKKTIASIHAKLNLDTLFGSLGVGTIFLLGFREYSLVYLFVQSLGGVYLIIFMSLISAQYHFPSQRYEERSRSSEALQNA